MRVAIAGILAALALMTPAAAQAAPTLSVDDVSVAEGDSGQTAATFTVTASEVATEPIVVQYATADGTARQPGDYTQTSGQLTILPGATSNTVLVPIKGDALDEADEAFDLNLSSATGATIADGRGVGTISDDDPPPTVSVTDAARTEGEVTMRFTVRLSTPSGREVTVAYATSDGSARAPGDYSTAAGTVTIPAGATSRTVGVRIREDALDEPTETFRLSLSGPSGATVSDGRGTGTIDDDDPTPFLSIRDARAREGQVAQFALVLSRPSGRTVTVRWTTAPRTATAGADFASASGTVTFPAGATTATVPVTTLQDAADEPFEHFEVVLSRPSRARLSDSRATGTIFDDDPRPNVPPRLSRLSVRPAVFRRAATIRWVLSERARVTLRVERRAVGRRVAGRCRPPARSAGSRSRCVRWVRLPGALRVNGRPGANRLRFARRIGGHRLPAGRYRLVAVAMDRQGARSPALRARFRIRD